MSGNGGEVCKSVSMGGGSDDDNAERTLWLQSVIMINSKRRLLFDGC